MAESTSVKIFGLEEDVLNALEASLSPQRLATYVTAAAGAREQALRLYTWNTAVSAAFYGRLQGLEVALRNATHDQLTGVYGPAWFDNHLSRADTHRPLDYLRTLRNRIAHHEPIFTRHLEADYRSLLNVTGWICPSTAAWIEHHSRVPELLRQPRDNGEVMF